jgi:hypothetical protein
VVVGYCAFHEKVCQRIFFVKLIFWLLDGFISSPKGQFDQTEISLAGFGLASPCWVMFVSG